MEIYRPEIGLAHEGALEGEAFEKAPILGGFGRLQGFFCVSAEGGEPDDDEEEYAKVTKPKMLDPSVVRCK